MKVAKELSTKRRFAPGPDLMALSSGWSRDLDGSERAAQDREPAGPAHVTDA